MISKVSYQTNSPNFRAAIRLNEKVAPNSLPFYDIFNILGDKFSLVDDQFLVCNRGLGEIKEWLSDAGIKFTSLRTDFSKLKGQALVDALKASFKA